MTKSFVAIAPVLLIVSACAGTADRTHLAEADGSAATWKMPWQLNPVSAQSEGLGERTVTSWVPSTGFVKGTPEALASIGRPLVAAEGPNRTVDTCRATVESEAMKLGAKQVEAVSAGAERRNKDKNYIAPVLMRITYAKPVGYEVRQARVTCIVDAKGKIVDARVDENA